MEKPATDIYTFSDLRQKGYTYVDKADIILPLVNDSIGKQFFMARPRRFGKSLLISTLQALFEGRGHLFTGLAIEPKWDWSRTWPVLHLDTGSCQGDEPGQMVLLVDEYDKPLLGHLGQSDVNRQRQLQNLAPAICPMNTRGFATGASAFMSCRETVDRLRRSRPKSALTFSKSPRRLRRSVRATLRRRLGEFAYASASRARHPRVRQRQNSHFVIEKEHIYLIALRYQDPKCRFFAAFCRFFGVFRKIVHGNFGCLAV